MTPRHDPAEEPEESLMATALLVLDMLARFPGRGSGQKGMVPS